MKYIFRNIFIFARQETMIFVILLVCVFASGFVMNFSYGMYYNYNASLNDANEDLKTIAPYLNENEKLTKGEFRQFIETLDEKTQEEIILIFASSDLTKIGFDEHHGDFPMRFDITGNKYCVSSYLKEGWEESGMVTSGRFFSDKDEELGINSAMIPYDSELSVGDTVEFLGQAYTVIGKYKSYSNTPIVPFLTVPDDLEINYCMITFDSAPKRSTYENIKNTAMEIIPNKLIFPDLKLPDDDLVSLYKTMILISAFVAVLSVMNFAMLYLFIIRKRKNSLAVMRLCGIRKSQAAAIYLGECLILSVPAFTMGMLFFSIILKKLFSNMFVHMSEAFSPLIYFSLFIIYLIAMLIILGAIIFCNTGIDIKECLAEGKV